MSRFALAPREVVDLHARHVSPVFIRLLRLWGYGRVFTRAAGSRLWDAQGTEYLDLLAGFGALPLGHAPEAVHQAIREVLRDGAPAMIHTGPPPLAGRLARRLLEKAPEGLAIALFASGGAEAVETALKVARRATGRGGLVGCRGGYHGASLGALSVGDHGAAKGVGPLLPGARLIPYGDLEPLERELAPRDVAAFIVEPIQGEGGVVVPPAGYLAGAAHLCRAHGTLLVVDEIQTGLGRTGAWFACETEGVSPDILLVGKALGAGIVPVSAALVTRAVYRRAFPSVLDHDLHTSTYGGGTLAMAVGLATIEAIEAEGLVARAAQGGERLGPRLRQVAAAHPVVRAARGRGLLWGLALHPVFDPAWLARLPEGLAVAGRPLIGQWISLRLLERGVLAQPAGHAQEVLRIEPPLNIAAGDLDRGLEAIEASLAEVRGAARLAAAMLGRTLRQAVRGFPAAPGGRANGFA